MAGTFSQCFPSPGLPRALRIGRNVCQRDSGPWRFPSTPSTPEPEPKKGQHEPAKFDTLDVIQNKVIGPYLSRSLGQKPYSE
jgi:hypothetical protein